MLPSKRFIKEPANQFFLLTRWDLSRASSFQLMYLLCLPVRLTSSVNGKPLVIELWCASFLRPMPLFTQSPNLNTTSVYAIWWLKFTNRDIEAVMWPPSKRGLSSNYFSLVWGRSSSFLPLWLHTSVKMGEMQMVNFPMGINKVEKKMLKLH